MTDETTDGTSDQAVKLGRVGHYAVAGACQEARICYVLQREPGMTFTEVHVAGDTHEGDHFSRRRVRVGVYGDGNEEFHFNRDCPDAR